MVNENIDIAMVLSISAGKHLVNAHTLHTEMTKEGLVQEEYFRLRALERDACIQAVILFQSSMEAIINEELESEPKLHLVKREEDALNKKFKMLSFKNKWTRAFEVLQVEKNANKYLDSYLKFYIKFRVPITHAKSRFVDAEKFNFLNVYTGIKNGYLAVESFYGTLKKYTTDHTWKRFIVTCGLPD